jgi:hypothetical protein
MHEICFVRAAINQTIDTVLPVLSTLHKITLILQYNTLNWVQNVLTLTLVTVVTIYLGFVW